MNNFNLKNGTPRPKPKYNKKKYHLKKDDSHERQQYLEILQFFYNI